MRLTGIELRRVAMPLRTPFRTSFGTERDRDVLLVRAEGDVGGTATTGWGECVAMAEPRYSAEYVDGAEHVIAAFFAPILFGRGDVAGGDIATVEDDRREERRDDVFGAVDVLSGVARLGHRHALTPADRGRAGDVALSPYEQDVAVALRAERRPERRAQWHRDPP